MQFSVVTTLFSLAAVAIAAPAEVDVRTSSGGGCTTEMPNVVCCSGGLFGCLLPTILGESCSAQTYCCSNSVTGSPIINIDLLNCFQLF